MASKKKSPVTSIARFTPNSIKIDNDGQEVIVPLDKHENAFLNMVLAAQGRAMIQQALKAWKDLGQTPSPKELRDIAGAMKDIASFSAEIYANTPEQPKPAEQQVAAEDINFDELSKPVEPNTGDGKPKEDSEAGEGTPSGDAQSEPTKGP